MDVEVLEVVLVASAGASQPAHSPDQLEVITEEDLSMATEPGDQQDCNDCD
jgi:hypothetical protein